MFSFATLLMASERSLLDYYASAPQGKRRDSSFTAIAKLAIAEMAVGGVGYWGLEFTDPHKPYEIKEKSLKFMSGNNPNVPEAKGRSFVKLGEVLDSLKVDERRMSLKLESYELTDTGSEARRELLQKKIDKNLLAQERLEKIISSVRRDINQKMREYTKKNGTAYSRVLNKRSMVKKMIGVSQVFIVTELGFHLYGTLNDKKPGILSSSHVIDYMLDDLPSSEQDLPEEE
jgi:hypothetical protein